MRINVSEAEQYIGYIIKVFTINDRRIAARLINSNANYLLLENSKGYRSRIPKDEIDSIFTMRGGA